MSLLVYGIVEANGRAVLGIGLEGRPLREIAEGRLAAIVTDHDGPGPEPETTALRDYEQVVQGLTDLRAILPAPFGRVLADDAAVRAMLRRRREDLLARLERVRGAVELGLHARWRNAMKVKPAARAQSGSAYLRDRLETRQSARRVASELDPLTALARGSRRAVGPRPDVPVLDAYLVDRGRVREFVALVRHLNESLDGVELVCTGPCPPYSFADGAAHLGPGAMARIS